MSDVAAVIPVRDGERFLGEAIASVLAQSEPPDEIVVVDDGSGDGSAALAATFAGVHVVSLPPSGPAAARNAGVAASSAPLVAFLDADDLMEPTRLAVQVAALRDPAALAGVLGWITPFGDGSPDLPGAPVPGYLAGALMVRRTAFGEVGPFDPTLAAGEFGDWHLRARDLGLRIEVLAVPVIRRRAHDANLTRDVDALAGGYLRVARLALERRRGRVRDTDGTAP
jgi:glycosyltransferase involved in cell wall biosynthesis